MPKAAGYQTRSFAINDVEALWIFPQFFLEITVAYSTIDSSTI